MPRRYESVILGLFIVEMEVATSSSDNIRNALSCAGRLVGDSAHIDTSTMECIKGINRVVHGNDESLFLLSCLQFCLEPGNLVVVKLAPFRHVRIEADNGDVRCLQGPIDVGLGHSMTRNLSGFWCDAWCLGTKVFYESCQ